MTEEEARDSGRGDEARDYVLGRETAAAILAAIPESKREPETEATPEPPVSETEARALALAEQLTAESGAGRGEGQGTAISRTGSRVVTLPAGPLRPAAERRRWALKQAAQDHPRVISPGGQMVDAVYQLPQPDGTTQPRMVQPGGAHRVHGHLPGEWDEWLVAEHARLDQEADELLHQGVRGAGVPGERHPVLAGSHRTSS